MKTRWIALSTALTLATVAAMPALADTSDVTLAWQEPGYVMEVVVVTAKRPRYLTTESAGDSLSEATTAAEATAAEAAEVALAWQQPGYVEEVVVVTAKRSEVLAEARRAVASRWLDARPLY